MGLRGGGGGGIACILCANFFIVILKLRQVTINPSLTRLLRTGLGVFSKPLQSIDVITINYKRELNGVSQVYL
jgi:hypothetical protein